MVAAWVGEKGIPGGAVRWRLKEGRQKKAAVKAGEKDKVGTLRWEALRRSPLLCDFSFCGFSGPQSTMVWKQRILVMILITRSVGA